MKVLQARRRGHLSEHVNLTGAVNSVPTAWPWPRRAPMKQNDARVLILQHWDDWISTHVSDPSGPTGKDSLQFFYELQDNGSPLLDFQSRGQDKWRIIHAWLLGAGRLSDHWMMPSPRIVPTRRPRLARSKSGVKT